MVAGRSETTDLAAAHLTVMSRIKAELEIWQLSVIGSYNGGDYKTP